MIGGMGMQDLACHRKGAVGSMPRPVARCLRKAAAGPGRNIAIAAAAAAMAAAISACSVGDSLRASVGWDDPCGIDWVDSSEFSESHEFWRRDADAETIESCLKSNAGLAWSRGENGATPLHMAALNSLEPGVLEALIRNGAEVDAMAGRSGTPLHWAAGARQSYAYDPGIIEVLVSNGADVEAKDGDGNTALHLAALDKNPVIAEVLLLNDAEVDARSNDGDTPLLLTARSGRNRGTMEVLVRHGADIDATDLQGYTPLVLAARNSSSRLKELQAAIAKHQPKVVNAAGNFQKGVRAFEAGDYEAALKEFLPLAGQGDSRVQYTLGLMYENGLGVLQINPDAAFWYRRAAEQGHPNAQNNLGVMYANGKGVPQDYQTAHIWLSIASENGSIEAREERSRAESHLSRQLVLEAERLARECIASQYNNCP